MNDWNILRAAGIGAYLMLWASVAWGLMSTTSIFGRKVSRKTTVALHQAFSTSGLILLAMHLGFLLVDSFMPFAPLDLIVPMRATYRPVGVTLGIASLFMMVLGVLGTSWGRKLIGTKWWRRAHALSVPAFTLALVHGLMTGSDTRRPGMFWMYVATAAAVLFLLVVRALTAGERPQRARLPEGVVRRAPTTAAPIPEPVAAAVAPTALPITLPAIPPAVPEPEPEREGQPAAAGVTGDLAAHRRRSPFAPRPVPIVFVQAEFAGAPPAYRIAGPPERTGASAEARRSGSSPENGNHTAEVISIAAGRRASNGGVNGEASRSGAGHPSPEGGIVPPTPGTHHGHAPRPHPKTRSPDQRAP